MSDIEQRLREAMDALEKCQQVLAMLTSGDASKPSVIAAYGQCVGAELVARRTLSSLREADHA